MAKPPSATWSAIAAKRRAIALSSFASPIVKLTSSAGFTKRSTKAPVSLSIRPLLLSHQSQYLTPSRCSKGPIIELHISNIHKREPYYHHSYVSKVATAVIAGLGAEGYRVATKAMKGLLK